MHVQHLQLQSLISKFHSTDYICVFTRCELIGLYMYLFIFLVVLLILVQPIFLAIINLFLGGRGKGSFIPFICHFIALLLCQFHYSYRNNWKCIDFNREKDPVSRNRSCYETKTHRLLSDMKRKQKYLNQSRNLLKFNLLSNYYRNSEPKFTVVYRVCFHPLGVIILGC